MANRTKFDTVDISQFTGGTVGGGITGIMCTAAGVNTYKLVKETASGDTTEYEITLLAGMVLDFPCAWDVTITNTDDSPIAADMVYVQYAQLYK